MTDKPRLAVVETIYTSNFRDVPATLRSIADDIEAGKFGPVGGAGLVLLGNRLEVFGMGVESDACSVGMLLHAGVNKLSRAIEDHGK